MSAGLPTTVSAAGVNIVPLDGAGTLPTGINYLVIGTQCSVPAKGAQRSAWDFRVTGEACGQVADLDCCNEVAVHFVASTASTAPSSAGAVLTFYGDARDLMANRVAASGFTYLRTINIAARGTSTQLIQPTAGGSYETCMCFEEIAQMNLPCLDSFPVAATDKRSIVAIVVARKYINTGITPAGTLQLDYQVTTV